MLLSEFFGNGYSLRGVGAVYLSARFDARFMKDSLTHRRSVSWNIISLRNTEFRSRATNTRINEYKKGRYLLCKDFESGSRGCLLIGKIRRQIHEGFPYS